MKQTRKVNAVRRIPKYRSVKTPAAGWERYVRKVKRRSR